MTARFLALILASAFSAANAHAQQSGLGSDYTNPGGAGSGMSGVVGIRLSSFNLTAPANGATLTVDGKQLVIPQGALSTVINAARSNGAALDTVTTALTQGGVPSDRVEAIRRLLPTLSRRGGDIRFTEVINVFNDAMKALPASRNVPVELLAIRWLLIEFGAIGS